MAASGTAVSLQRSYTPTWAVVGAVVAFFAVSAFSLLFLLVRAKEVLLITVASDGDAAFVEVSGVATMEFLTAFEGAMEAMGATPWSGR
ncbi:MAG: hypothetical protein H0V19_01095 [Euzebyales bacterium]|nr:hypothetical protein [Euzebyales bacterium]